MTIEAPRVEAYKKFGKHVRKSIINHFIEKFGKSQRNFQDKVNFQVNWTVEEALYFNELVSNQEELENSIKRKIINR